MRALRVVAILLYFLVADSRSALASEPLNNLQSSLFGDVEPQNLILTLAEDISHGRMNFERAITRLKEIPTTTLKTLIPLSADQLDPEKTGYEIAEIAADLQCEVASMIGPENLMVRMYLWYSLIVSDSDESGKIKSHKRLLQVVAMRSFHEIPDQIQSLAIRQLSGLTDFIKGVDWSTVVAAYEKALELSDRKLNKAAYAHLQVELARAYQRLGQPDLVAQEAKIKSLLLEALSVFTLDEFPREHAFVCSNLGFTYSSLPSNDPTEALEVSVSYYRKAITALERADNPSLMAYVQLELGGILLKLGRRNEALKALAVAVRKSSPESAGNEKEVYVRAAIQLCQARAAKEDLSTDVAETQEACSLAFDALKAAYADLSIELLLRSTMSLVEALQELDRHEKDAHLKAMELYERAMIAVEQAANPRYRALLLAHKSAFMLSLSSDSGRIPFQEAVAEALKALTSLDRGDLDLKADLYAKIGSGYASVNSGSKADNFKRAEEYFEFSKNAAREVGNKYAEAIALAMLGEMYSEQERTKQAEKVLAEAFTIAATEAAYGLSPDWRSLLLLIDSISRELVSVSIAKGDAADALVWSDASKARFWAENTFLSSALCEEDTRACVTLKESVDNLRQLRAAYGSRLILGGDLLAKFEGAVDPSYRKKISTAIAKFEAARRNFPGYHDPVVVDRGLVKNVFLQDASTAFLEFATTREGLYALVLYKRFGKSMVRLIKLYDAGDQSDSTAVLREIDHDDYDFLKSLIISSTGEVPQGIVSSEAQEGHSFIVDLVSSFSASTSLKWSEAFWYWHLANKMSELEPPPGIGGQEWMELVQDNNSNAFKIFSAAIGSTIDKLDKLIGYPIAQELSSYPVDRLVIVEDAITRWPLSALPSLDRFVVSFTPSLRDYARNRRTEHKGAESESIVIANPTDDLFCSEVEGHYVADSFKNSKLLAGDRASAASVLELLSSSSTTANQWYITGHATYDPQSPSKSGIFLSDRLLTINEIFEREWSSTKFVVLSGCDTFLSGPKGWTISLPAVLTTAGIPRVLGTLWRVDELASLLLLTRFTMLKKGGLDEAESLHRAQAWLRSLSAEDALSTVRSLVKRGGDAGLYCQEYANSLLMSVPPTSRPFESPYFWAAFTLYE